MAGLVKREGIYILLLIFIILFNAIVAVSTTPEERARARQESRALLEKRAVVDKTDEFMMSREEVKLALAKRPTLSLALNLTSLALLVLIALGLLLDGLLAAFRMRGGRLVLRAYSQGPVRWSLFDVAKVGILFLSFAYVMVITESLIRPIFPVFRNDNFRMMFNSSILDLLAAAFVIYFAVYKYHEKLIALGLTMKNLFRNIFYGIAGYIACIPVFIASTILVLVVVKLLSCAPQKQPVVELFLKEENPAFLIFSSLFASIFGPFIEELFFRGFMYNAAKKMMGIFWATILTAAIFAALHTNVVGFLPIMVLGVLLAYMYEKTGSLVSSITIHVMHNLAMVYTVFLVKGIRAI